MLDLEQECWWLRPEISGVDPALIPANRTGPAVAVPEVHLAMPTFGPKPELPEEDKPALLNWIAMRHKVLTAVKQVVDGDTTAFFLWGPGGHGKDYIVAEGLRDHDKVRRHRGDMSALGLFLALQEFPDHVHVLEDMEKLYREQGAQQVLRAACGGVESEREVRWDKAGKARQEPFVFEGGIIVVSNDDPRGGNLKLGAIASRFSPVEWRLLDPELAAVMRHLAINDPCPYDYSPEVRLEVAEYVIAQMDERPELIHVDLRTFKEHAMPAYHQWRQGRAVGSTTWQDVVRMKIEGSARPKTRVSRVEEDRRTACKVYLEGKDTEERHKLWHDRTGLGSTAFHDRLKEARESGLFEAVKDTWDGPK